MTQLTQNDFSSQTDYIINDYVVEMIRTINNRLHTNLPIHETRGNTQANRSTLRNYLNRTDYINNEGLSEPRITFRKINNYITRKIKEQDDEFFNHFNKEQYKYDNKLDELIRKNTHEKLNKRRKINDDNNNNNNNDNNKLIANEAFDETMKLIKSQQHHLLQFEPENQEIYDYLNKHHYSFKSKHKDFLIINIPYDFDKAVEKLSYYDKYSSSKTVERNDISKNKPIIIYYFNEISSLQDIYDKLQEVFLAELKPFKIHFQLSGIFETYNLDLETREETYTYEAREIRWKNYQSSIPIIIKNTEDINLVKLYIESTLSSYETTSSNNKLTIVSSISFTVSRMIKITGKIEGLPEEIIKSKSVIADNIDDKLCWYRFLSICLNPDLMKALVKRRTQIAKQLLLQKYGISYSNNMKNEDRIKAQNILDNYQGTNYYEMKEEAKQYNLNINIYEYNEKIKQYDIKKIWKNNDTDIYHSALLFTFKTIIHIMYIKPNCVESLTKWLICPKCRSKAYLKKYSDRMKAHIKVCDGKFHKSFVTKRVSLPYCPHILNNSVYEYCLAYNLEWKPNIYYITYDFETMEKNVNDSTKSTIINSHLIPISVSSCIKSAKGLLTKHFCLRDSKDFIINWIEFLFQQSLQIYNDKILHFQSFTKINDIKILNKIDKNLNVITVFGFNSSKFDSNLFKQYLNISHWYIEQNSLIGTATSLKQFILSSNKYDTKLRFIDAQSFTAGGTLKQFGIDYGGLDNSNKGVFPYEAINSENYNEVLSKSEPFAYNDFYSYLNQNNPLTKEEYEEYVKDSKNYRDRWAYLLAYNDNDVEMMIKPIDNLINQNAQYKVDMISNLSLSKCSTSIKYALAYKNFDVNAKYAIVNTVTTFEPSLKWWIKKCANYKKQDELYNAKQESKISKLVDNDIKIATLKSKISKLADNDIKIATIKSKMRNIENCVSENDYQKFLEMYKNEGYCYLCNEHFTYDNKPVLDRIDNNIGHELNNCKLCCKKCNNLRNRKDEKITRLRIQLKKYCTLYHLPTTVTDEKEYYNLRQNMTGGISNVLHRYCIKNETYINRFRYTNDNKVVSEDTENKITHILGLDFNSLYPSVFSSIKHDFIDYHGNIMFMPGSFIRRFEVYDENGDKNKEIYKKCLNIIFSKYRYKPNPKYLFIATVKLICPKNKINYFINFPPVIRNITIKNDENVIGSYMYNYMKEHKLSSLNKEEKRLTQLLDTCGQYMTFSNYYLWFLLDHGLILEDVKSISLYEAHNQFHEFVTTFMKKRQDIISKKEKGNEKFYKISMNGSYGYDGVNSENFSKIKICNKDKAYSAIISDSYINGIELNDNCYLIQQQPKHFKCNTPLQEAFFTLDNAKYFYLVFYYDFLNKALDMKKIHVNTCETDSIYFSVSGYSKESAEQEFKFVIKNQEFWNKNAYKFLPNPNINTIEDTKKLLGCCVEKYGDNQIALCSKCYTIFNNNGQTKSMKLKGVSLKKNKINKDDYVEAITKRKIKYGKNINLQVKSGIMSKITTNKLAINAKHTKMITLENQSCCPFIHDLTANDIIIKSH